MTHRRNQLKRAAFTLTEMAIVLGIAGVITGGIWAAASSVYEANRSQKAQTEVLQIIAGYRSLYTQHQVDVADWTDITCMGVNAGFFPADMNNSAACSSASAATIAATYPIAPWAGSYAAVYGYQSDSGGIIIGLFNLPQAACNSVANAITNSPDVMWEGINATSGGNSQFLPPIAATVPFTTVQINNSCVAGSANTVYVMYRAR